MKLLICSFTVLSGSVADSDIRHTTLLIYCSISYQVVGSTCMHTHTQHTHMCKHMHSIGVGTRGAGCAIVPLDIVRPWLYIVVTSGL